MNNNLMIDVFEHFNYQSNALGKDKDVYKFLNNDLLNDIVVDNNIFWFEMNIGVEMPKGVFTKLKKYLSDKGYTYLYDYILERQIK